MKGKPAGIRHITMDIYLIRHGQSTGNGRNRFLGWSDHPLTDHGRAQAEAAAARLAPLGPMPVLCSDLQRARTTAEIIAMHWGGAVQPDARWREIHCGRFEDCLWDDFTRDTGLAAQFDADPFGTCMPEGESAAMMAARVLEAFAEVRTCGEGRLAIVSHDGPIRAIITHALHIPSHAFWNLMTDHGGLTHVVVSDDWLGVRTVNDISHLADLLTT